MKARDNPFATERVHAIRYRPLNTTFDRLLARLHELNYRAAITGPEGSGKTTLLEDLQRVLEQKGFRTRLVFVNDTSHLDSPACRQLLSELTRDQIVLLDGADLIRRSDWSLLKRHTITHAYGLVITSHRRGLLPTLIECSTTPALLREIVADLQPQSRTLTTEFLDSLYERHEGNLRACLRELYDLYAIDNRP
jgi:energy-coupling factor transporter ATP-binding protein EcfA2